MTDKPPNAFTMFKGKGFLSNDKKIMQSQRNKAGGAASYAKARPQQEADFQEKLLKRGAKK